MAQKAPKLMAKAKFKDLRQMSPRPAACHF